MSHWHMNLSKVLGNTVSSDMATNMDTDMAVAFVTVFSECVAHANM